MTEIKALAIVLRTGKYRLLATGLCAMLLVVYLFTLPAVYTGGVVGLISLKYLTAELALFSIALALFLSLTLTLNIHAFRASSKSRSRGAGVSSGAILASLLPSGVCCTSLVPSLLAILGASTPQIFGMTGRIQGFVASNETAFLAFALVLVLFSFHLAAKASVRSCPAARASTSDHDPEHETVLS